MQPGVSRFWYISSGLLSCQDFLLVLHTALKRTIFDLEIFSICILKPILLIYIIHTAESTINVTEWEILNWTSLYPHREFFSYFCRYDLFNKHNFKMAAKRIVDGAITRIEENIDNIAAMLQKFRPISMKIFSLQSIVKTHSVKTIKNEVYVSLLAMLSRGKNVLSPST